MNVKRARALRKNVGEPERRMWSLLYSLRQERFHFRRQAQIGRYYADFACLHGNLIIEIDGDTHGGESAIAYDAVRDAYMRERGLTVLRFSNDDVMHNGEGVFDTVVLALEELGVSPLTPTPVPSPQGGGRRRKREDGEWGKTA
jgi:very-short-patch-repair endonuclease